MMNRVMGRMPLVAMAVLAIGVLAAFPSRVAAAEIEVEKTQALTTGTTTVAYNAFAAFDLSKGSNTTQFADDLTNGRVKIQIRVLDDTSSSTLCRVYVKVFSETPVSGDLDGSTEQKTGVPVEEGDVLTITPSGRYLGVDGNVGTSYLSIVRVE